LKDSELNQPPPVGKRVMVLGGGNVALDCASVAKRLGAVEVHVSCLESYGTMTASKDERTWAEEEGVILHNSVTFPEIVGKDGRVTGVRIQGINSFSFDENGRTILDLVAEGDEIIPADSVIFAIGQRPVIPEGFGLSFPAAAASLSQTTVRRLPKVSLLQATASLGRPLPLKPSPAHALPPSGLICTWEVTAISTRALHRFRTEIRALAVRIISAACPGTVETWSRRRCDAGALN
jgi:pyruvate/2-oxoglutarate dehydrogenase complex dihydrolipoamide dehydrogenase (E3) component